MKYAPSALVGQLSGSAGSTTASRNRYGAYIRNRAVPVNPNTVDQQLFRARFGNLSAAWRELSNNNKEGWSLLAPEVPRSDALGQSQVLSGQALYIGVNQNRLLTGQAIATNAPALDSPPTITALSVQVVGNPTNTIGSTFTVTGGTASNFLMVRATPPLSPGKAFLGKNQFRVLGFVAGNATSPQALATMYNAKFGTNWQTQYGMQIAVELVPISANGFAGVPVRAVDAIEEP